MAVSNVSTSDKDVGLAYKIRIPHPYCVLDTDLAHQKAIHPSEAELNELDSFPLHVLGQCAVNPCGEITQSSHLPLYARLSMNIIVLNAIEKLCETPEAVCFDSIQNGFWKLAWIHARVYFGIGDVLTQKDLPERCDQIIDALHVAGCGVSYCPKVEYSLQASLCSFIAVELNVRICPGYIDTDLMPNCFVEASRLAA